MSWNGNGVFDPPGAPEFPAIPGDLIRAAYFNTVIQALCDGFVNTVPRDGQAPWTGVQDAGGFTVKNLRAAMVAGEAVRFQEFAALQSQVTTLATPVEPFIYLELGII